MKKLLLILFTVVSVSVQAQHGWIKPNNSKGTISNGLSVDTALFIPTGCGAPTKVMDLPKSALYGDSCNNILYKYNPKDSSWSVIGNGADSNAYRSSVQLTDTSYKANKTKGGTVYVFEGGVGSAGETVTASNGLTKVGSDIQLGGALTKSTTINGKLNNLTIDSLSGLTLKATASTTSSNLYISNNVTDINTTTSTGSSDIGTVNNSASITSSYLNHTYVSGITTSPQPTTVYGYGSQVYFNTPTHHNLFIIDTVTMRLHFQNLVTNAVSNYTLPVITGDWFFPLSVGGIHADSTGNIKYRLTSYTVATLPASATQGDIAYVTDASSPTYLGTLTGGGSTVCPVFFNGTAWVAH